MIRKENNMKGKTKGKENQRNETAHKIITKIRKSKYADTRRLG